MSNDLEGLTLITELVDNDFDLFKIAVRTLLTKTFIIRGIDKEEELYNFTIRNSSLFDSWFSCMDAILIRDESLGVICFRGSGDTRLRLGREETCALLTARLLYEEKRVELSLTAFPTVTVFDFVQKYNVMVGDEIKKTRLIEVLRRLQSHKLVEVDSQDLSDMEGMIILYPSLAMSVDRDSIDELLASLAHKGKTGGGESELPEADIPPEEVSG
ncbi:MAG: DUF4194 domain-containing protein [Spirochaetaceae bacterium]|jgi:hypothetical protein|nr:DUF4194 domain-containing protein [Spirochaetaceae bacterium]